MVLLTFLISTLIQEAPAPPGKLIDVGGFKMHIYTTGKGETPVVLLAGSGNWSLHWSLVQSEASRFAQISSVDYQGLGWSEFGPQNRGLTQEAYEVKTLLHNAGVKGPYILVGQSLGGLIAWTFAHHWPEETAGVIFVDSSTPDLKLKFMEDGQPVWRPWREKTRKEPIPEISKKLIKPHDLKTVDMKRDYGDLSMFSPHVQDLFRWFESKPFVYAKGMKDFTPNELAQMHSNPDAYHLEDLPVTVISGDDPKRYEDDQNRKERLEWHQDASKCLLGLSNRSRLISAKKSGHWVHIDEPNIVVMAIKEMIESLPAKK